jgi:flagellar biosynthesis protein FlhF
MEVKTYRAPTMQEALRLVRRELGPNAAVLHTREVCGSPWLRWIPGLRQIEVMASTQVNVPSRMPPRQREEPQPAPAPRQAAFEAKDGFRDEVKGRLTELQSMVEDLARRSRGSGVQDLPEVLFHAYTDLIDAEVGEELARELIERVRNSAHLDDRMLIRAQIARMVEDEIRTSGPIAPPDGGCHLVALVGPTGVGKTTTIAKLAANFRLREKRKVGLITVDTYRIAAVEQLRTYADIIDLPMKVVSSPREMREAVRSMADLDLVLLDTAGRSPKDEVKIQELRSFLSEAGAHEVHLVLSSVASASTLERTAERFAATGTTAMILTKLDEATSLGNLLPLLRSSKLPLSYLTDGQNVPDDISPAHRQDVARRILGMPAGQAAYS